MGAVFTTLLEDYNTIFSYRLPSQNLLEDSSDEEEPFMVYVNASTRIVNIDTSDSDWTWPTGTPPPPTHWSQGPPQLQTSWSPGPTSALWAARISTLNFLFLLIKSSFYNSFLLWWMAVLLFRAKPVSGSTSRKWDKTCLALLTRMYCLASLSTRWDGCQTQSIALNRAGEMFAETQFSCWKLATDALVALQYQAWILNTLKRTKSWKNVKN